MLALARTLAGDPSLVVIDEPGEGLAPQVLAQVAACLATLRERGAAMLLIEERLTIARALDARVAVMGHGAVQFDGPFASFARDGQIRREWLSVG
jgi:branched-chain amino acid transport system ATP-binding protein